MKLGHHSEVKLAITDTYLKARNVFFTPNKSKDQFRSTATGKHLLVIIFTQPMLEKLGPLLLGQLDSMDTSVKELLAIASPKLLRKQCLSIVIGMEVLVIISTQPVLQRLEQPLLDKLDCMGISLRVWLAMSFLTMDESLTVHVTH